MVANTYSEQELPAIVWPQFNDLDSANRPIRIYLDMNHWISLAQASTSHSKGAPFKSVLDRCIEAKNDGSALFPLSMVHHHEMTKIKNPKQRKDIADVMETLSGFQTLLSRTLIMDFELDVALAAVLGISPLVQAAPSAIGFGLVYATGGFGATQIFEADRDITREFSARNPDVWNQMIMMRERMLLQGPDDSQLEEMKALGYRPEKFLDSFETLVTQEKELVTSLNDPVASENVNWRQGRIHDVIVARELVHEYVDRIHILLEMYQIDRDGFFTSKERLNQLMRCMPSSEVIVAMKVASHKDATTNWNSNYLFDINGMAVSIPYCDIVVTEKHAAHQLKTAGIDERLNTVIVTKLEDLPMHLAKVTSPI